MDFQVELLSMLWFAQFMVTRINYRLRSKLGVTLAGWDGSDAAYAAAARGDIGEAKLITTGVAREDGDGGPDHLPIIFIHYGRSDYLRHSLEQARLSNPNSPIYLIGDQDNNEYPFVEHYSYQDYFRGASEFAHLYRHFCDQEERWILYVFQRWFVLREFLAAKGLQRCLHIDSDIMLYSDVTEDIKNYVYYDFTTCHRISGAIFFLNRVIALENFCKFLLDIYSGRDSYHYDRMLAHFLCRQKNKLHGGATEMTALDYYGEAHFGEVGEVSQILAGAVHDPNINVSHPGFEMENGIKRIIWKDGQPYGRHLKSGREIRFKSLHFQGSAKALMSECRTVNRGYAAV